MENYGGNILANYAWGTNQQWSPQWDSSATPVSSFPSGWIDAFHIWKWIGPIKDVSLFRRTTIELCFAEWNHQWRCQL